MHRDQDEAARILAVLRDPDCSSGHHLAGVGREEERMNLSPLDCHSGFVVEGLADVVDLAAAWESFVPADVVDLAAAGCWDRHARRVERRDADYLAYRMVGSVSPCIR